MREIVNWMNHAITCAFRKKNPLAATQITSRGCTITRARHKNGTLPRSLRSVDVCMYRVTYMRLIYRSAEATNARKHPLSCNRDASKFIPRDASYDVN